MVLLDLSRGMQHFTHPSTDENLHHLIDVRGCGVLPLFELDERRCRSALIVVAGDHHVQSARRQWKLVLADHPVIVQVGQPQYVSHLG